jgi:hypothetical protein
MSSKPLPSGSIVLRLEFSIADAVHQRGLFSVLVAAVSAWWHRPRLPAPLPAYLRADLGLPPESESWPEPSRSPQIPPPLWRPGM